MVGRRIVRLVLHPMWELDAIVLPLCSHMSRPGRSLARRDALVVKTTMQGRDAR